MKAAIISGSHRNQSQSMATAGWVSAALERLDMQSEIFDLSNICLNFWSEEAWNPNSEVAISWKPISEKLKQCSAIVLVAPEWAGGIPPKLSNFLLHCSNQELSYKPTLLISVSGGASGTYPIAQLRMSVSKNNQMIYLPDHLIIRNAQTFFKELNEEHPMCRRLCFNLEILRDMAKSLNQIRETIDLKRYPYGL